MEIKKIDFTVEGEPKGKESILKAVADALNGVCYKDDKCLIKMSIEKFYSDVPRIEVTVQEVEKEVVLCQKE